MRVRGAVGRHAGDGSGTAGHFHYLPDRVRVAEIPAGHGLGHHQVIHRGEDGGGISAEKGKAEHLEESGIHDDPAVLIEGFIPESEHLAGLGGEAHGLPDPGKANPGRLGQGTRGPLDTVPGVPVPVGHHPDNLFGKFVETVIAQLIAHPEQDEQGAGHSDGQARDIDDGESLVPLEVSHGENQATAPHSGLLYRRSLRFTPNPEKWTTRGSSGVMPAARRKRDSLPGRSRPYQTSSKDTEAFSSPLTSRLRRWVPG